MSRINPEKTTAKKTVFAFQGDKERAIKARKLRIRVVT
jgi:hypothetical protein